MFSLGAANESGVASFGMLTFGQNSPHDALRVVDAGHSGPSSTSENPVNAANTLAGLQELYTMHQKMNIATDQQHKKEPNPSSIEDANSQHKS